MRSTPKFNGKPDILSLEGSAACSAIVPSVSGEHF